MVGYRADPALLREFNPKMMFQGSGSKPHASNFLVSVTDSSNYQIKAMQKMEFIASMHSMMTPTVRYADIILPAFIFGTCNERPSNVLLNENMDFKVYPNPANDILFVELENQIVQTISLIDITGRLVKTLPVDNQSSITMDLGGLNEGLYMLILKGEGSQIVTRVAIHR